MDPRYTISSGGGYGGYTGHTGENGNNQRSNPVSNPTYNSGYTTGGIMSDPSRMIETMMMSQLFGPHQAKDTSPWVSVAQMLVMMMLPDIRAGITWSIDQIRKLAVTVCQTYLFIVIGAGFTWLFQPTPRSIPVDPMVKDMAVKDMAVKDNDHHPISHESTDQTICVSNSNLMSTGLYTYIISNPNTCKYTVMHGHLVSLVTTQVYERTEYWVDTTVTYKNMDIRIPGKVTVTTNHNRDQNVVSLTKLTQSSLENGSSLTDNQIQTFSDLLPNDEIKDLILEFMAKIRSIIPESSIADVDNYTGKCGRISCNSSGGLIYILDSSSWVYNPVLLSNFDTYYDDSSYHGSTEVLTCAYLKLKYPNLKMFWSIHEVSIYEHLLQFLSIGSFNLLPPYRGANTCVFGYKLNQNNAQIEALSKKVRRCNTSLTFCVNLRTITTSTSNISQKTVEIHRHYVNYLNRSTQDVLKVYVPLNSVEPMINAVQFTIPAISTLATANATFDEFINELCVPVPCTNNKQKVDIYTLSFVTNTVTSEQPNPEYEKFHQYIAPFIEESEQKKETEVPNTNDTAKEKENAITHDIKKRTNPKNRYNAQPIPEPTISQTVTTKYLECKKVGTGYKDVKNLFLRETDQTTFINALSRFRDDKKLMDELGVPNKLGILLDGLPGTGKSTSILVMGSFLQKAIYYVDASQIDTNDDLQAIYDYIPTNCPNGGILVFEDVDASCPVLLRRDNLDGSSSGNVTNTATMNTATMNTVAMNTTAMKNSTKPVDSKSVTLDKWLNLQQGFITPDGLLTAFSTNRGNLLDPAFTRKGRIDCRLQMRMCDRYQISRIFERFIRRPIDPAILAMIDEDLYAPVEVISQCVNYVHSIDAPDSEIMEPFIRRNKD